MSNRIFPWKWNEPPNRRQFAVMVVGWVLMMIVVAICLPRLLIY